MSTYSEKLNNPRWFSKRAHILSRDNFKCKICNNESSDQLEVHHKYYLRGKEPWEYENNALITLCKVCHEPEDEFRAITFNNLPARFFDKAIQLLNNGFTNQNLYFYCVNQFKQSQPTLIGQISADFTNIVDRWELIKI